MKPKPQTQEEPPFSAAAMLRAAEIALATPSTETKRRIETLIRMASNAGNKKMEIGLLDTFGCWPNPKAVVATLAWLEELGFKVAKSDGHGQEILTVEW